MSTKNDNMTDPIDLIDVVGVMDHTTTQQSTTLEITCSLSNSTISVTIHTFYIYLL